MTDPLIRRYLQAIEAGDDEAVLACLDPEVVFEELPNKVSPRGSRRDLATLRTARQRNYYDCFEP